MTSGAKTADRRLNLMEKRYRGMKKSLQCFFEFFPAIIPLEIMAIVCENIVNSSNLTFGDLW